jgi:hypothetical protein
MVALSWAITGRGMQPITSTVRRMGISIRVKAASVVADSRQERLRAMVVPFVIPPPASTA